MPQSLRSTPTTGRMSGTTRPHRAKPGTTPTQHIIVADLALNGQMRRVVMQAPKNGFFYVLDAKTGALISAEKFTDISWATHVDMKTGRPVETRRAVLQNWPTVRFTAEPEWRAHVASDVVQPPNGLVYIPAPAELHVHA